AARGRHRHRGHRDGGVAALVLAGGGRRRKAAGPNPVRRRARRAGARPWPAALPEAVAVSSGQEETRQAPGATVPAEAETAGSRADPEAADAPAAADRKAVVRESKTAAVRAARARQEAESRAAGSGSPRSWAGLTTRTRIRIGGVRLTRVRRSRIFLF